MEKNFKLSKKLREKLVEELAVGRADTMFGDGQEEDYIYNGITIVGLSYMTDAELIKEYKEDMLGVDPKDEQAMEKKTPLLRKINECIRKYQGASEGTAMNTSRLVAALKVMVYTRDIYAYLKNNDPMALKQAISALKDADPTDTKTDEIVARYDAEYGGTDELG